MRLDALLRLAFASATPPGLTSPHTVTRWLILQKARHRGRHTKAPRRPPEGDRSGKGGYADDTLTVCKPTVSGTISLPSRGAFHLSLTVLVHYRSPVST